MKVASYEGAWLRENDQTHRPGWVIIFFAVRIDLHLQLQLQVHKKLFHHTKYPDCDLSSLAAISTWEAGAWCAL